MRCTKCKHFDWCPTRRGFLCCSFSRNEKMTYKEWLRYKRNKNRAKKRKKKKEAGALLIGCCSVGPILVMVAYSILQAGPI